MRLGDSARYQVTTQDGADEWDQLVPTTGATITDDSTGDIYTVAMFHQLQCLAYLRHGYAIDNSTPPMGKHCLNYLRQVLLCHAETRLEPVFKLEGPGYANSYCWHQELANKVQNH
jgi:hypothetical protein